MKIRIFKQRDGTARVVFVRSLHGEGRNTSRSHVTQESLREVLAEGVEKMRPTRQPAFPEA